MKEQDIHLMLWQKRNELSITDDVQQDWFDMQATLDVQMPVGNTPAGNGGLSGLSGFKLLSVLLATLGAATLIYFAIPKNESKNNHHKKNTTDISVANKNDRTTNAINTNNDDSLSAASTASANINSATPASANTDKTKSGTPPSSNTTNGNTVNNSATAGNNAISKGSNRTTNGVPTDNRAVVNANNHPVKGGATVIANNKASNNTHVTTRPASSPLNNTPNNDVKTTGPVNHLAKPGTTATVLHNNHMGNSAVSGHGNGLVRYRRNHPHHAFNGQPSNNLSKLTSGRSSRKGKNNPLTGNGKLTGNAPDPYTGAGQNPGASSTLTVNNTTDQNVALADAVQAKFAPEIYVPVPLASTLTDKFKDAQSGNQPVKNANNKAANSKNPKLDWGILTGANTTGSFTAKKQNANFYGSFPVDAFFGLFATYNLNDKWGVNLGIRGLNPQNLSGSYSHANDSKIDTLQTLNISDSRKVYFVDVPLNLVFKPNAYLSLKAGPVFSLPIKQVNGSSSFQTGKLKKDSIYYVKVTQTINATNYTKSINTGLSVGASVQAWRFVFDAAYIKGLKGLTVGSTLGSYTANGDYFLFTVGFKLNRLKK